MIVAECSRHLPFTPTRADPYWHYTKRCTHIDSRFVVDVRDNQGVYGHIDYVEDLPGGGLLVEAHSIGSSRSPIRDRVEDADQLFDSLVGKMQKDVPPDQEWWR